MAILDLYDNTISKPDDELPIHYRSKLWIVTRNRSDSIGDFNPNAQSQFGSLNSTGASITLRKAHPKGIPCKVIKVNATGLVNYRGDDEVIYQIIFPFSGVDLAFVQSQYCLLELPNGNLEHIITDSMVTGDKNSSWTYGLYRVSGTTRTQPTYPFPVLFLDLPNANSIVWNWRQNIIDYRVTDTTITNAVNRGVNIRLRRTPNGVFPFAATYLMPPYRRPDYWVYSEQKLAGMVVNTPYFDDASLPPLPS